MWRRKRDAVHGRVIDLSARRPARRRVRVRPRRPRLRLPRFDQSGRHAAIWAAIWAVLLFPALLDFLNGYVTESAGCRAVAVIDGDTIGLMCPGDFRISNARVLGFDTPEIFSPKCLSETIRGTVAKWDLRLLLWRAGRIEVHRQGHDRYGRDLVRLSVDGADVAHRMIGAGLARPYGGGRRSSWCA